MKCYFYTHAAPKSKFNERKQAWFCGLRPILSGEPISESAGSQDPLFGNQEYGYRVVETEIEQNGCFGLPWGLVSWGSLLFLKEVAFPKATGPEIKL